MTKNMLINLIWAKSLTLALIISVRGTPIVGKNNSNTNIDKNFVLKNVITNPKISESGKIVSSKHFLICEHFELPCIYGDNKCHKNKTCKGEDEFCYTTWKPTSVVSDGQSVNSSANIDNESIYEVKGMGCMPTEDRCQKTCVHADDQKRKHGHLYCCCTGNAIKDIGCKIIRLL